MTINVNGPDGTTVRFPDGTDTETINKVMTQHFGGQEPSGSAAGVTHGTAEAFNAVKATAKNYFGVGDGPSPEDPNYVPANVTNGSLNPLNWNYDQLPQKAAELAPGIAQQLIAAKAGASAGKMVGGVKGAALGALLASGASLWAGSAGNAAKQDAVDRTGDKNAEPNASDLTRAGLTSAASAAAQSVFPARFVNAPKITSVGASGALDAVKKYLTTTGVAGAAGAAGNTIDQVGNTIGTDKGVQFDPSKAAETGLANMAITGALGAPRLGAETVQAANRAGMDTPAMGAYIQRLTDAAGPEGLGSGKKDYNAQENAKAGLRKELQAVDHSNMDQDTQNALSLARSGKPLTTDDVARITASDAQAGHLADQLYHAQQAESFGTYDTSNKTWAGGVSGKMDKLMRNYVDPTKVLTGVAAGHVLGLHLLGTASPAFAGAAVGSYGLARVADSLAGLRSPAKAFAERFQDASAATRLPSAQPPAPPAPPPPPPTPAPWGPRPLPQQSVPPVAPPGPPQPAAPQFNPIALSTLKQTLKTNAAAKLPEQAPPPVDQAAVDASSLNGATKATKAMLDQQAYLAKLRNNSITFNGPPLPPAAPPAPEPTPAAPAPQPPQVNPLRLPTDITASAKNLMKGLANAQAMRQAAAPGNGSSSAPTNGTTAPPGMADALNHVNAITAPAKISKKAGGKVEVSQPASQDQAFDWDKVGGYTPGQQENPFRGKSPAEIARISTDAMQGLPELRKLSYFNNTLGTRTARDNVIGELTQAFPGEQSVLDALRQDLHAPGNSDQAQSMRVLKHYTSLMSPEAAQATRAAFRRADVRDAVWPPAKAKTNGKSKETKEEVRAN